ncbi:MAG: hypothetical protein N3A65_00765 [candidate division WOR-3 bacterium]|nr:hypothetical protein [candidate division WOR-3 bacterium]
MSEILKNSLLVGLGIAGLGRKKLMKFYNLLKNEGEAFKEEIPVLKKRWQKIETFSQRIDEIGGKLRERVNLATKKELSELQKKIEKILKQKSAAD